MLSELDKISEVNEESVVLYARLWQLEKWLREMVYVELKSKKGRNWINFNKTKNTHEADQKLPHIPTPDQSPISYTTFSELVKLIKNNWEQFSMYLPPQNLWEAKLEEIIHIRNRIAHYRKGHADDLDRMLQLMRDIDLGFWEFCTSYNDVRPVLPQDRDPVTKKYSGLDPFSPKLIGDKEWATIGSAPPGLRYIVSVNVIRRNWAEKSGCIDGTEGYIYDVNIYMRNNKQFDYTRFLSHTKSIHSEFIHICLETSSDSVRVTIPAILGSEKVIELIDKLIDATEQSIALKQSLVEEDNTIQNLSEEWPEYVLGPKNPLTFLCQDMKCSFFNVLKRS